jgi:glycosyltransferase involved in cell wall biosynthesis
LYGGIDPEPFLAEPDGAHFEAGKVRLLYFGRLLPQKGVHTAIEALGLLHQWGEAEGVSLTLLGDGHPQYEAQLRALAAEQQVADRVIFAGRVGRNEIPIWLPNFDIFLFTSTWPEPFGRTIVEAMAAGLVVIGSTVGGSSEIFEHYAPDLLFQPEDAETLAAHIGRVRHNQQLQREMVRRGRQVVCDYFTHERMAENFERWLLQLYHQKSSF